MPDTQSQAAQRIAGRKLADEAFELDIELAADLEPLGQEVFYRRLAELAQSQLTGQEAAKSIRPEPMSDYSARLWGEQTTMKSGAHAGKWIEDVPLSYLLFLTEDNEFRQQLRRYLASPRIQREMETERSYGD